MTDKREGARDAFAALERHFGRLAEEATSEADRTFWKRAADVDYRHDNPFRYDMKWKDVSVLTNALKDNRAKRPNGNGSSGAP